MFIVLLPLICTLGCAHCTGAQTAHINSTGQITMPEMMAFTMYYLRFFLIENLNENLNEVLPKILIFDEVLGEVLDF